MQYAARKRSWRTPVTILASALISAVVTLAVVTTKPAAKLEVAAGPNPSRQALPRTVRDRQSETATECIESDAPRVPDFETQLEQAENRAAAAETKANEYRLGLQKAVRALNAKTGELAAARRAASTARTSQASTGPSRGRSFNPHAWVRAWTPSVSIVGGSVAVAGEVFNASGEHVDGRLEVTLRAGDRVVQTDSIPMSIAPGQTQPYTAEYQLIQQTGLSASVQWRG